jgi:hypothetical protein
LLRELWNLSQLAATSQGDPNAGPREAVGPVSRKLAEEVTAQAVIDSDLPVYVIEMEGHFSCDACTSFQGKVPTGTVVNSTLSAATLLGTHYGLTIRWTSLASLGTPFVLPRPPGPTTFWAIDTGPALSFMGQWTAPGAEMTLDALGGKSSVVWSDGRRFIDFTLDRLRSPRAGVLPGAASGAINSDNVDLSDGSGIVLLGGESGLSISITPPSGIVVPGPFRPRS